jgi:hypothetical protein
MSKTVEEAAAVEALVQHARHGDRGALAGLYDRNQRDVAAKLAHPGIQRLLDSNLAAELPYLEFEYVEGPTLAAAGRRRPGRAHALWGRGPHGASPARSPS